MLNIVKVVNNLGREPTVYYGKIKYDHVNYYDIEFTHIKTQNTYLDFVVLKSEINSYKLTYWHSDKLYFTENEFEKNKDKILIMFNKKANLYQERSNAYDTRKST